MSYSANQIKQLWTEAGGNPAYADMAVAIAMAESGGNPDATATNSDGSVDRGLWQINSVHGSQSTTDPMANARAAISISDNGTNWRPWSTAWSGGGTNSGTYLGEGSAVLKYSSGMVTTGLGAAPSGATAQTAGLPTNPLSAFGEQLINGWKTTINNLVQIGDYIFLIIVGAAAIVVGVIIVGRQIEYRSAVGQKGASGYL